MLLVCVLLNTKITDFVLETTTHDLPFMIVPVVEVKRRIKKILVYSFTKSLKNFMLMNCDENFIHNTPPTLVVKHMLQRKVRRRKRKSRRSCTEKKYKNGDQKRYGFALYCLISGTRS